MCKKENGDLASDLTVRRTNPELIDYICNPSTGKMEAGGSEIQAIFQCEASLSYMRQLMDKSGSSDRSLCQEAHLHSA